MLIDGKLGAGLGSLTNLPGIVGPLATDTVATRNALGWVYRELQHRYRVIAAEGEEASKRFNRLVILFDEFQEFTADPLVAELLRRIVSRGRAARVHTLLATQHPTIDTFGNDNGAVKRNLPGRIALKVLDAKASEVVIGAPAPRADRLTGAGDVYAIDGTIHRTQLVLVDHRDLERAERQPPVLNEWPEFQAEGIVGRPPYLLRLTEHGREAYRRLFGAEPVESEYDRLLARHKSVEHVLLNLHAREALLAAGAESVDLYPRPVALPGGGVFDVDIVAVFGGKSLYIEAERPTTSSNRSTAYGID